MKNVIFALILSASCLAQTAQRPDPKDFKTSAEYVEALVDWKVQQKQIAAKTAKPDCTTVVACKKLFKDESQAKERADDERDLAVSSLAEMTNQRDSLLSINKDMTEKNAEQAKKIEDFKVLGRDMLNSNGQLIAEYKKLVDSNSTLTDQYNSLLQRANAMLQEANSKLARQQRINNALAVYGMMPKYSPPQTINVNVTDCSKTPALCIH